MFLITGERGPFCRVGPVLERGVWWPDIVNDVQGRVQERSGRAAHKRIMERDECGISESSGRGVFMRVAHGFVPECGAWAHFEERQWRMGQDSESRMMSSFRRAVHDNMGIFWSLAPQWCVLESGTWVYSRVWRTRPTLESCVLGALWVCEVWVAGDWGFLDGKLKNSQKIWRSFSSPCASLWDCFLIGEALKLYQSLVYETCPPANIFNTALTSDEDNSMELQWPPISLPTSSYYAALYFVDMSKGNSRTFDVFINGYTFYHNLEVISSGLVVFVNNWNLSSITRITLHSEFDLPIISADEVFGIMTLGGITSTRDGVITIGEGVLHGLIVFPLGTLLFHDYSNCPRESEEKY
ncbi:hypothetical protein KSP40_PGU001912 [Platanthera guangdongensis]|uniref:Malectin-like domain-containing protein n=1 Tax=Platanthera guangdongensis TaxID=2320717 RepID=A0ABR2M9P4_9ASPA